MPYKPFEPTEEERSNIYFLQWIGMATSIGLLIDYFFALPAGFGKIFLAATAGILLISIFSSRFDEHYMSLRNEGCRWALAIISLMLIVSAILSIGGLSDQFGSFLAAGETNASTHALSRLVIDAELIILLACTAFFTGVLFKSFRP